jgi:ACS family glucarate transporter-like MFS transporter
MISDMSKPTNIRWVILTLISVASFISYVIRSNLSIVGLSVMAEFGFTEIQFGRILAAFTFGYAVFQFPGGVFGDVLGSRKAITFIAVLWGVFTILNGIIPAPPIVSVTTILVIFIVLRFVTGASHAPIFPVTGGIIANWFPVSGWGLPNGLTSTALTLGAAAAAPLMVWLMQIAGWRGSFFLTAPLAFLIAIVWWWYARDYPDQHRGVNSAELELIHANRTDVHTVHEKGAWKQVLKDRNMLLLTLSYFCSNYVFYQVFNWIFIYLVDIRKVGQHEAGYLTAAQWIAAAIGATLGGFLCDYFARKVGPRWGYRIIPIPSLILTAVFLFFGAISSNPYLSVGFFCLSFGCQQLTEGSFWAAIASIAGRHTSVAGGLLNTGGNAVGGVGALLVPVLAKHFGWTAAIASGAVFAIVAALLWFVIKADEPIRERGLNSALPLK